MLLSAVERALADAGIGAAGGRVLIACSGGVDSVVLADACVELAGANRVVLGHVDHAARPGSADDAQHVARLAAGWGVELHTTRLEEGPNSEARLRAARYRALEAQRAAAAAGAIFTAHTRDDQAETVLLGLVRRTRLAALGGIPRRRGAIFRPLLDVPRTEIDRYARRRGLIAREDPTNREPAYLRNRIRKELLPLLELRYRQGLRARLAGLAREVSSSLSGARLSEKTSEDLKNTPDGSYVGPHGVPGIAIRLEPWRGGAIPDGTRAAAFDAAALEFPTIRCVRPGDRIRPFGMRGRRKVHDVLAEAKVPRALRPHVLVVARPDGGVIWIPGLVRSADAPVGSSTRDVWVCSGEAPATCGGASDASL
jgi:tRNA(Ile)-lysidine synthase